MASTGVAEASKKRKDEEIRDCFSLAHLCKPLVPKYCFIRTLTAEYRNFKQRNSKLTGADIAFLHVTTMMSIEEYKHSTSQPNMMKKLAQLLVNFFYCSTRLQPLTPVL
jgi:hypothetical protein